MWDSLSSLDGREFKRKIHYPFKWIQLNGNGNKYWIVHF